MKTENVMSERKENCREREKNVKFLSLYKFSSTSPKKTYNPFIFLNCNINKNTKRKIKDAKYINILKKQKMYWQTPSSSWLAEANQRR